MKAYSADLRRRVVAARFAVSVAWDRKFLRRRRSAGPIEPKPHGAGHAPAFDSDAKLRQAVGDAADATH